MKPLLLALPLLAVAASAEAQLTSANARFSVGLAVDRLVTVDGDASDAWGIGPIFRIGPDRGGWGPSFGLGWFDTRLPASVGGVTGEFAEVEVRPVMAGLGYTFRRGPWSYELGVAAGWTFNSAKVLPAAERYFADASPGAIELEVSNGLAVRPRLRVYYDTPSRVALMGAVGVVFADPEVRMRAGTQSLTIDRNLTSLTIEGGIVFALF